jgi:manganese/zinc/iron transport system permease protein
MNYLNPYSGLNFLQFIQVGFQRFFLALTGRLPIQNMASDEIQILTLALISISAAIVGVFLIHRKMTMLANALSHTVLFGIVLTYLILRKSFDLIDPSLSFRVMFFAALITGFVTALLSETLSRISSLQKDASIGLVFTTFFALGILLITLFSKNSHFGIELIMGNVDSLHYKDLSSVFWMLLCNVSILALFMRSLKLSTFDSTFSKLLGLSPTFFNYLIVLQLSLTAIGAFRAIGAVLILAFFIVPPHCARPYARSLEQQVIFSALIGVFCSFLGVALSRHLLSVHNLALSTGGLTVLCLYATHLLNWGGLRLYHKLKKRELQGQLLKKETLEQL